MRLGSQTAPGPHSYSKCEEARASDRKSERKPELCSPEIHKFYYAVVGRQLRTGIGRHVGAQTALLPPNVRHRVGSWIAAAAGWIGRGFRAGTARELASFGDDRMQIYNGRVPAPGGSQLSSRQYYLNYQDYLDIRDSPYVRNAAPIIYRGDLRLVSEYASSNGYVDGSEPQFYDIRYQPIEQGRWLNWSDEQQRNNVCVIGSEFIRILFPGRPVVGSRLLING
ncbi:MAG TPA: ABC transporter permease, partial [Candidatus Sulfotelmatobacter sp.]|nr:ABC transporter permease [Candidatus Sulfotelmatobacter sp.]